MYTVSISWTEGNELMRNFAREDQLNQIATLTQICNLIARVPVKRGMC